MRSKPRALLYASILLNASPADLVVSKLDHAGRRELGDRVDRTCRWAVPAGFFGGNALSTAYFLTFY